MHAAVDDFPAMLALMQRTVAELVERPGKATPEEIEFLRWLEAERFVFLGARVYEFPKLPNGDYAPEEPLYQAKDGLGVLRDPERTVLRRASEPAILVKKAKDRIFREAAVTVGKYCRPYASWSTAFGKRCFSRICAPISAVYENGEIVSGDVS